MLQTIEAVINESGQIRLTQPIGIKGTHRALVTVLDEPPVETLETTKLSEQALAADWLRSEEDDAWSHLQ